MCATGGRGGREGTTWSGMVGTLAGFVAGVVLVALTGAGLHHQSVWVVVARSALVLVGLVVGCGLGLKAGESPSPWLTAVVAGVVVLVLSVAVSLLARIAGLGGVGQDVGVLAVVAMACPVATVLVGLGNDEGQRSRGPSPTPSDRRLLGAALVVPGLALLVWFPAWTATSRTGCHPSRVVGDVGVASGPVGALLVGAAVAAALASTGWRLVVFGFVLAVPVGGLWLVSAFSIGFQRCFVF